MRSFRLATAASALLLAACCHAAFIEPKGDKISDEKGHAFTLSKSFTLFGTEFTSADRHYLTRGTGRIMFGTDKDLNLFDPEKQRVFHMLQPLEITLMPNSDSYINIKSLWYSELNQTSLSSLSEVVKQNFWDLKNFEATEGRLFTWERQGPKELDGRQNDFQAALITDGPSTFVIYNYVTVNYIINTDTNKMLAGFSKASSFESSPLPFSGTESQKLQTASGVGSSEKGRFVYRVDAWPPVRGGCLTEDPELEVNRVLSTSVVSDSVLGGATAIVSGRCHSGEMSQQGTCSISFNGKQVATSPAKGCDACGKVFLTCSVPPSLREGQGKLSLSLSNARASTAYSHDFQFVGPDKSVGHRILLTEKDHWMQLEPEKLALTFPTSALNESDTWTLKIFGYSEEGLSQLNSDEAKNSLIKEVFSQELTAKTGSLDLRNPAVECLQKEDCVKYHVGFLQISDSSQPQNIIRSDIVPLGWFVHPHFKTSGDSDWFNDKCKAWSETTGEETTKVKEKLKSLTCPCTKQLAESDTSRFLPVSYCPHLAKGCSSATPDQTCFVSNPVTAADLQAAPASLCCYDKEKNHLLHQQLMVEDSTTHQGSRSLRSHPDGFPSAETLLVGQVSFMSHWYWDTLKQLYCCRWSNVGFCPFYFMPARPTPSCSNFKLGRSSSSVGDPHLTSFNGQNFLFNGYGEFWLVRTDTLSVQGRFLAESGKSFSLLKAVGVKVGDGAAFEVKFSSGGLKVQRRLNDETMSVTLTTGESYHDGGVTLRRVSDSQLIVVLISGADSVGVDIHAVNDLTFANIHVSLSDSLKSKTRGLLGRWTENAADGFVNATGSDVIAFDEDMSAWNSKFCEFHRLENVGVSLFNYEESASRSLGFQTVNVDDKDLYMKSVKFTDSGLTHPNEAATCGDNSDCLFDIRVTQDETLAKSTKSTIEKFKQWRVDNYTAAFCDRPEVAGIKIDAADSLAEGTSLRLSCVSPLSTKSKSADTVKCERQQDGTFKWNPEPNMECALPTNSEPTSANVGLIIGIVGGCLALIIIVVIVVFVVLRSRDDKPPSQSGDGVGRQKQQQQQPQAECAYQAIPRRDPSSLGTDGSAIAPVASSRRSGGKQQKQQQQKPHMNTTDVVIDDHNRETQQPSAQMESAKDHRFSYQQSQQRPVDPEEVNYQEYAEPTKVSRSEVV